MSPVTFILFCFIISCAVSFHQVSSSENRPTSARTPRLFQWSRSFDDEMQRLQTRINKSIRKAQKQAVRAQALANAQMRQAEVIHSKLNEYLLEDLKNRDLRHSGPGFRKRVIELDNGRIEEVTINHISPDGRSRRHARSYIATFKS